MRFCPASRGCAARSRSVPPWWRDQSRRQAGLSTGPRWRAGGLGRPPRAHRPIRCAGDPPGHPVRRCGRRIGLLVGNHIRALARIWSARPGRGRTPDRATAYRVGSYGLDDARTVEDLAEQPLGYTLDEACLLAFRAATSRMPGDRRRQPRPAAAAGQDRRIVRGDGPCRRGWSLLEDRGSTTSRSSWSAGDARIGLRSQTSHPAAPAGTARRGLHSDDPWCRGGSRTYPVTR